MVSFWHCRYLLIEVPRCQMTLLLHYCIFILMMYCNDKHHVWLQWKWKQHMKMWHEVLMMILSVIAESTIGSDTNGQECVRSIVPPEQETSWRADTSAWDGHGRRLQGRRCVWITASSPSQLPRKNYCKFPNPLIV